MRGALILVAALVMAAAVPAGIPANASHFPVASGDEKSPSAVAHGTVSSVSETSLVIKTDTDTMTFTIDAKTEHPDDLKTGDLVDVYYHQESGSDERIATRIVKAAPPSGPEDKPDQP